MGLFMQPCCPYCNVSTMGKGGPGAGLVQLFSNIPVHMNDFTRKFLCDTFSNMLPSSAMPIQISKMLFMNKKTCTVGKSFLQLMLVFQDLGKNKN